MITAKEEQFFSTRHHETKLDLIVGKRILNFHDSYAVSPGHEYVRDVFASCLVSRAPVTRLKTQLVGLALQRRVMDGCAWAGGRES